SPESWLSAQVVSQHQSVGQETYQPFDFGSIPISNRCPHADVFLATIAVQQDFEYRQREHKHSRRFSPRHHIELTSDLLSKGHHLDPTIVGLNGRSAPVRRQVHSFDSV